MNKLMKIINIFLYGLIFLNICCEKKKLDIPAHTYKKYLKVGL